jgi:hypothetical protein
VKLRPTFHVPFKQANAVGLFRAHFRWLLLEDPEEVLQSLNVPLDSDVTVGRRVSEGRFSVMEVYKRGPNEDLVRRVTGVWQADAQGVQPTLSPILSVRRMNLQKSLLKAVMVVCIFLKISFVYFYFFCAKKCKYLYQ